jgi:hypothetical protein
MTSEVRFHLLAELELNETADFRDLESRGLGGALLDDIGHALARLIESPELGAPAFGGVRKRLLTRFAGALLDGRAIATAVIAVASGCTVEIAGSGVTRDQVVALADALTGLQ